MHWLAVHLPALPLEVYPGTMESPLPLAVGQDPRGERVLLCNPAASGLGVRPGQGAGAALALAADLRLLPRRPEAETAALERLAAWSSRFTPMVSLAPPCALVLDVAASLRLFGGGTALLDQVAAGVTGLGYRNTTCLAPTPGAALTLAGQGMGGVIADTSALRRVLGELPLGALGLDRQTHEDLAAMGLRRVADLLRLPRTGLALRIGPERLRQLRRMLGDEPDPRPGFVPPPHYSGTLELPAEVPEAAALVFACRRLIEELCGDLLGRQAGVQRLGWRLGHADLPDTQFTLGASTPGRDPQAWLALLRERLGRLALPAPVRAITLTATDIRPLTPAPLDLFPELALTQAPDPALLDRLRSRLGEGVVRGLQALPDHRPERAWRWCPPGTPGAGPGRSDRPLWLLPEPRPLELRDRRPWYGGPLDLGDERERIETGWWDDLPVARDYFVATTVTGERLWVYRECHGGQDWFLHGRFG
jgi:protein ImuB